MNIAILLTVYNRKEKTLRCLNSLVDSHAKAGSKIRYKVFLTDDEIGRASCRERV